MCITWSCLDKRSRPIFCASPAATGSSRKTVEVVAAAAAVVVEQEGVNADGRARGRAQAKLEWGAAVWVCWMLQAALVALGVVEAGAEATCPRATTAE